jgi:putative ABC transport system permease protein
MKLTWSDFREIVGMSLAAIAAHKLRSALTLLGIVVGVFSIIVVMTAVRVLQSTVEGSLAELGANTFVVQRWPGFEFGGPDEFEKYRRRKSVLFEHGERLKHMATMAKSIGMEDDFYRGIASSKYANTTPNTILFGMSPEVFSAKNMNIAEGRALMDNDESSARQVCVLAANTARALFPNSSPLQEKIKIDGLAYTVVGVLEAKGGMQGGDQDNYVVVPLNTTLNRYGRRSGLRILVEAHNQEVFADTMEQVRGALRTIRKVPPGEEDDFEMFSNDSLIERFNSLTLAVRLGAGVISSIALITAGIGIMNIMLVSVTERTREIGIRRAIGAKKRHIMTQFITEAIFLCQVGGVAGIIFGILGGNATAFLFKVPPVVPYDWAILGMIICSVVGIVFGTYPAFKAANLNPIDSLRYE